MASTVKSQLFDDLPLFHQEGVIFEKFIVDQSTYYTVYFLATSKDYIFIYHEQLVAFYERSIF